MSIPGVGTTIATTLISEIGSIIRFPSGDCLIAFTGLDPRVKQSGIGLHHNTHLTKRGSPYLRRTCSSQPALRSDMIRNLRHITRRKEAEVSSTKKQL